MSEIKDYLKKMADMHGNNGSGRSFPAFVLEYGHEFKPAPRPKGMRQGTMKQCFKNACQIAHADERYTYAEGYAISKAVGFPLEHAFLIDADGNVADPTWKDGVSYYGVPFQTDYVVAQALKIGYYGVFNYRNRFAILDADPKDFLQQQKGK